jgi:ABC-2 type transport system ATP-binding protein
VFGRDGPETSGLEVLHGLLQLSVTVHHERPVVGHRLTDRLSAECSAQTAQARPPCSSACWELERYSGEVKFGDDKADMRALDEIRAEVFPAFDHSPLYPHLSGYDNLRLLLGCQQPRSQVTAIAEGLIEDRLLASKARRYSYGQRKKVYALALALRNPLFPLLDELSNGLDQEALQWLEHRITGMKSGRTIVMTGHHFNFYGSVVDDVFVLHEGQLTKIDYDREKGDTLDEIYANHVRSAV